MCFTGDLYWMSKERRGIKIYVIMHWMLTATRSSGAGACSGTVGPQIFAGTLFAATIPVHSFLESSCGWWYCCETFVLWVSAELHKLYSEHTLLGQWSQGGCTVWTVCMNFVVSKHQGKNLHGGLCVDRRIMLKFIFKKGGLKILTELHWLRVGSDGLSML